MSAALTAQPGLHSMAMVISMKAKKRGRKRKRKKSTMVGGACATVTLSTMKAQAAERVEQKLSPQYAEYSKGFNKPKDGRLPPRHPFDHTIDLKESFVSKVARVYPMNPKEMEACKEFIDEHLKSGKIWKSQSPQASCYSTDGPLSFSSTCDPPACSSLCPPPHMQPLDSAPRRNGVISH